jgi:hypothetical protein
MQIPPAARTVQRRVFGFGITTHCPRLQGYRLAKRRRFCWAQFWKILLRSSETFLALEECSTRLYLFMVADVPVIEWDLLNLA